jgi:ribosomal-protein-alanine N-acetyltransferase
MRHTTQLDTQRLTMVAATLKHVRVELESPEQLSVLLDAQVSAAWPTGEYDRDAMEFFRARLEEGGPEVEGWYGWYAVRKADARGPRALVGAGGYFGPPDSEGVVEIGYSMLPEWRRMGYASEVVRALLERAFSHARVTKVIAHTAESNPASSGVLLRCGFVAAGAGEEADTLRFEHGRTPRAAQNNDE